MPVIRAAILAGLAAALFYVATLQLHINGSPHVYTTDVGEIQNALPRWGTLHFTGYPLYSFTGSAIVTLLRAIGVQPAAGASAVSLIWGVLTVGAIAALARTLGASTRAAVLGALVFAVSTSAWMFSSVAEVHSLTMLLSVLCLWQTIRFARSGSHQDLLLLALVSAQGALHMRAIVFLAPALTVLIWPRWRVVLHRIPSVIGVGLASSLVYLYMPLREWMGASWTFGQTSTWPGFLRMVLDTKADRIIHLPSSASEIVDRTQIVLGLLRDDLPLSLLALGLVSASLVPIIGTAVLGGQGDDPARGRRASWRLSTALLLAWLPYAALCIVIWEGRVSDALLAVKLPILMIAGLGLSLGLSHVISALGDRRPRLEGLAMGLSSIVLVIIAIGNARSVRAVTSDRSVEAIVLQADTAAHELLALEPQDVISPTLVAPWGRDFWAMAYAQEYRAQIRGFDIVDHNADVTHIAATGAMLVTPSSSLTVLGLDWWYERVIDMDVEMFVPGIVALRGSPLDARSSSPTGEEAHGSGDGNRFEINDDLALLLPRIEGIDHGEIEVRATWLAKRAPERDYRVAVHLLGGGETEHIISQSDQTHPVEGWRPTSAWSESDQIRDAWRLSVRSEDVSDEIVNDALSNPIAVRITAYYVAEDGSFVNGEWVVIPINEGAGE